MKLVFVEQKKIPKLEHTYLLEQGKTATCFEKGYSSSISCSECGIAISEKTEIPYAHNDNGGDGYCDSCGLSIPPENYVPAEVGEYV